MNRLISGFFTFALVTGFIFILSFTINWYFNLPIVKITPDQRIVAVEIKGESFSPQEVEIGDRYIKKYVSFEWKTKNL